MRVFQVAVVVMMSFVAMAQVRPKVQAAHVGFDRNDYPGDAALPGLRKHFSFVGYWLTNPPGEKRNNWVGKRETLLRAGFGFLVLANGRSSDELKHGLTLLPQHHESRALTPMGWGEKDGGAAIAAAKREHFPPRTILFLDQEEGGRLEAEQTQYLFGWTEAVAKGGYRPGVYGSGQPIPDGPGKMVTTAQDIREKVAALHLHPVAMWVYQDACPPSNGCSVRGPAPGGSGTPDVVAWQYAQSPRRKEITASCANTYAADGSCYAPGLPGIHLDLNVASSGDPSHGR